MTERHVFLTGASGYVGRNLIRHLTNAGHQVTGLARSDQSAELIAGLGANVVRGDLLRDDLSPLMAGATELVHAAANLDHGPGRDAYEENARGAEAVMCAASSAGLRRLVYISSDSVLQDGRPLRNVNEGHPVPARHAGAYSSGKAEAERIALKANSDTMAVIALRPRMIWGRDDTTALPTLAAMVRSGQFAWISGGHYLCSATHVGNLCHAVGLALTNGRAGEVYHISDGPARSFRDTVTGLLATQGILPPDKSVPRPLLRLLARAGDGLYRLSGGRLRGPLSFQEYATSAVEITLNISKAKQELGYLPIVGWEEGLEELRARNR
ncbi:NAD-dependent epimerase/dehydratase family protein [Breoghania sp. L-A4]|uniref:NAD-dependent epimerase/dehydratase family protein n=1 Tax=Breoghania sp. L-A4 TaxID=2304600 RepID=UPI000E35A01B|nr:NAD-dependent epimerase/dehydratase family protein [Breoghania sp. L-A4]AXS41390.1 NAD-dependent epimerase/dehydratase family protein [Breoghania sp. L-A4]